MQVSRNDITVNDRLSDLLDNLENDRHERYDVTYDNGDWFANYPTISVNIKDSSLTIARIFVGHLGGVMDATLGIRKSKGYADIYDHLFANTEEQVTAWRIS